MKKSIILLLGLAFVFTSCSNEPQIELKNENISLNNKEKNMENDLIISEDSQEYINFVDNEVLPYMGNLLETLENKYGFGTYDNWKIDPENGIFTFYKNGKLQLKFNYQEVGTYSFETNTWLWGYENEYIDKKLTQDILKVKKIGEENNYETLVKRKFFSSEDEANILMAISAYILDAKGFYVVPSKDEKMNAYIIFTEIEDLR